MTLILSRRHKRTIALAMVFVWLFALSMGVTNACLMEPRGEPVHAQHHGAHGAHAATAATHSHTAEHAHDDDDEDKAPCQKSCDESSQTLLKQLPKVDTPGLVVMVPPTFRQSGAQHEAMTALVMAALAVIPPPMPPPRVQFSRLTL